MKLEDLIDDYLTKQHCILWGRFFDIKSTEGHRLAREFILDLLIDMGITKENVEC